MGKHEAIRVHRLAFLLGTSSKTVISVANSAGIPAKSASSRIANQNVHAIVNMAGKAS